jgi:hypothetical protein
MIDTLPLFAVIGLFAAPVRASRVTRRRAPGPP